MKENDAQDFKGQRMSQASQGLISTIRRLAPKREEGPQPLDISPGCAFGAVVEERLKTLEHRIEEVKARLNGLLFLAAGAVVAQVVIRLLE